MGTLIVTYAHVDVPGGLRTATATTGCPLLVVAMDVHYHFRAMGRGIYTRAGRITAARIHYRDWSMIVSTNNDPFRRRCWRGPGALPGSHI